MIFIHSESREPQGFPADHRSESRLSIPRRGALQQSSSPLPQPSSSVIRAAAPVQKYSANGECLTFRLCHIWGAPHTVQNRTPQICNGKNVVTRTADYTVVLLLSGVLRVFLSI